MRTEDNPSHALHDAAAIDEGQDDVLVLAAAVVIDLVSHPDENKS